MNTEAQPVSTMLLGLGNPILGDDGIGCRVAELVNEILGPTKGLKVLSASVSPVRLVDRICEYSRLIIVDSVTTGEAGPGELLEISFARKGPAPPSAHHFSVDRIPEIAEALSLPCPGVIKIYGIEIIPPREYGDSLSPSLERLLPSLAEKLIQLELKEFMNGDSVILPRGECAV
ncbi:MAG: hydrogenase maturation protease [Candidatus Aegiribacteria sp.]